MADLPAPRPGVWRMPGWLLDSVKRDRVSRVYRLYQRCVSMTEIAALKRISISQVYINIIGRAREEVALRFRDDVSTWVTEQIEARGDIIRRTNEALDARALGDALLEGVALAGLIDLGWSRLGKEVAQVDEVGLGSDSLGEGGLLPAGDEGRKGQRSHGYSWEWEG